MPKETTLEELPFYRPSQSADSPDGFKGRIGIAEVLTMTPTIRELVIQNSTSGRIEEQAKKEGMITMIEDGIYKCVQGQTTIEEVLRVVSE